MITWALKKVFGTSHERAIRRMRPRVEAINALEADDEEALRRRAQGQDGRVQGEARQRRDARRHPRRGVRRRAARRAGARSRCATTTCSSSAAWSSTTGCIAEMRTGEGKTLVATLPCYLNALEGKGVHVVTVNDYLATPRRRVDGQALQLPRPDRSGTVVNSQGDAEKKRAYRSDITYGQNNEFGFDYLRDNMKFSRARVRAAPAQLRDRRRGRLDPHRRGAHAAHHQRPGRARRATSTARSTRSSRACARTSTTSSTRRGTRSRSPTTASSAAQKLIGHREPLRPGQPRVAPHPEPVPARAHALQARRELPGHRRRQGPHHRRVHRPRAPGPPLVATACTRRSRPRRTCAIQEETRTMATITFQNLFRLYKKLAGMTGTADTEADRVPRDLQARRRHHPDEQADHPRRPRGPRLQDRAREVHRRHQRDPRVPRARAAGPRRHDERREERRRSRSILKKKKIPHAVLNAKHHENEAYVVAQAGRKGAITVSHQHGRSRHRHHPRRQPGDAREARVQGAGPRSRRRARGVRRSSSRSTRPRARPRATRCASSAACTSSAPSATSRAASTTSSAAAPAARAIPGSSRFYLSLEDDLMRIFAGDRVKA